MGRLTPGAEKRETKTPKAADVRRSANAAWTKEKVKGQPARPRRSKTSGEAAPSKRAYLKAEERRRLILEAAREVFSGLGPQSATTRKVAEAAEVNVATLFQHFESKEDLFTAAIVDPLSETLRDMDTVRIIREVNTADELRTRILPQVEKHLRTMIDVYPLMVAALFSDPVVGKAFYCDHIMPLIKKRAKGMSRFLADGVDAETVCIAGLGIEFAIAMDHYFRGRDNKVPLEARHVRDLVFSQLRPAPKPLPKADQDKEARKGEAAPHGKKARSTPRART